VNILAEYIVVSMVGICFIKLSTRATVALNFFKKNNLMLWQDIVITTASIVFSAALVPQIYRCFKEKKCQITRATSGPTFIGLFAVSYTYYTLNLFLSTVVCFITAILWLTLFIQRIAYKTKKD
jgi:hypothetical protein